MQSWDLNALDVEPHLPAVLQSNGEGRTIVIELPRGETLQEHQVHERAWIFVIDGEVLIAEQGKPPVTAGPGWLTIADPRERHELVAASNARVLLVLAPWPGDGHPSQRTPIDD